MEDDSKILQIIPASDWVAIYDDSGELLDPIVCFALVETTKNGETYREVRSMVQDGKLISFADESSNFVGIKNAAASQPL